MKCVSTMPFNSMGVISAEKGEVLEISSEITLRQLEQHGFIEPIKKSAKKSAK